MLREKAQHRFAPPRAFGGKQNPPVKRRLKILQRLQRLFRLAVHRHIWQRKRRAAQLGMNLRIGFQAA